MRETTAADIARTGLAHLLAQGGSAPCAGGVERLSVDLDAAASTGALVEVAAAVNDFLPGYASIHRGAGRRSRTSTAAYEQARHAMLAFAGREGSDDVAVICRNTTEAINHLAFRLDLGPDDVVVTTVVEHHANLPPGVVTPRCATSSAARRGPSSQLRAPRRCWATPAPRGELRRRGGAPRARRCPPGCRVGHRRAPWLLLRPSLPASPARDEPDRMRGCATGSAGLVVAQAPPPCGDEDPGIAGGRSHGDPLLPPVPNRRSHGPEVLSNAVGIAISMVTRWTTCGRPLSSPGTHRPRAQEEAHEGTRCLRKPQWSNPPCC